MTWKSTSLLREAYTTREPNELEQRLAAQAKPGAIPEDPGMRRYVLASVWRLPASDPRRQLLLYREINHEELTDDDLTKIFGSDQSMA